ncbi:uncharacterized protein LOC144654278 [Oculina patagonica]
MADFHFVVATTLVFALILICAGIQSSPHLQDVYVSKFGHDSVRCGSHYEPCRSIKQAVLQVNWGGRIFLNGTGTKQHPFDCDGDLRPIYVNKTLAMIGLGFTPYVSCDDGIYFRNSTDELQELSIELSGIVFQLTTLTFDDCFHVKLSNCSFQYASTALSIQIQNSTTLHLDIKSSTFFYNTRFCIKLVFLSNITSHSLYYDVSIKVFDTEFMENGLLHRQPIDRGNGLLHRQPIDRGVIKITSKEEIVSNHAHVHAFFQNVNCERNRGPFINLNVSTAIMNETYKNVYLKHNTLPSFGKTSNTLLNSLYHSVTKETRAKFINFQCMQNPMFRCIAIQSDKADVDIRESKFIGHNVIRERGPGLFLEATNEASLKVLNSNFTNNKAYEGGAVFANSPHGTLDLKFSKVNFKGCSSIKRGCAITVGRPPLPKHHNGSCPSKLNLAISNVKFNDCHGKFHRCITVYVRFKSGRVVVEESKWVNNLWKTSGALHVYAETTDGGANVTISRSSFKDNEGTVLSISALNANAGNATVVDSLIAGNKNRQKSALSISPKYRIKLDSIAVANFRYGLKTLATGSGHEAFPANIAVVNCTFTDNIYDMLLTLPDPTSVHLIIKNTIFTSNEIRERSYAIRLHIPPLRKINSSNAVIELDNNTFDSRPSSSFALFFQGNKTLSIRRSIFRNCICLYREKWALSYGSGDRTFYETATGALSILTNPDKPLRSGCVHLDVKNDTHPLWTYHSHVLIENTTFQDNAGLVAGGVYISNGYTRFERCTFRDNLGIEQTGHVYSAYGTGQVHFKDCSFFMKKESLAVLNNTTFNKATFLYSESGGPMKFQNTSMISFVANRDSYPMFDISSGGYVELDEKTTIQCGKGGELLFENTTHFSFTEKRNSFCKINVTSLKFSCKSCSPGYYSLHKGSSRGFTVNAAFQCLPCPFGATCIHSNIAAKPNFWGHPISRPRQSLQFITCPDHYCQSPATTSKDYNSCWGNRTGILCGVCASGYIETLLSTECLPLDKCNNNWFWILTFLATTGLAIYLLTKPPVLTFIGRQMLWCRRREQEQVREDLDQPEEHSDSGYLKIVFYFYQVAELLTVGSTDDLLDKIPFISSVVACFNFRVRVFKERMGCPFIGLTAVTKELLLSGTVFATMTEVVIMYCVHLGFNIIKHKVIPSPERYMAVLVEIMLLGYEKLAETSFKLMDCVAIGSEKRLFLDGNVLCWQWWQYALLAYATVFVVPFIFVLYFGSSKLYRASISASEFLGACIVPLPFLIYWFTKGILKTREHDDSTTARMQAVNQHVLEVLHGPFRPPNEEDKGTLYWESILIGRRFTLLACHAFIDDKMLCLVFMTSACVLMLLHHVLKNPYRDPIANRTETVSLLVLVMIALINLTKATLISFGTGLDGPTMSYVKGMEWVEICAMALLPTLLSFYVLFAILSQICRLIVFLAMKMLRYLQLTRTSSSKTEQLRRPLIDTSQPGYGANF